MKIEGVRIGCIAVDGVGNVLDDGHGGGVGGGVAVVCRCDLISQHSLMQTVTTGSGSLTPAV